MAFEEGLFEFLGVEPQEVKFNTRKQSNKPREEIIANLNEIRDCVSDYLYL
jgi:hypothetical protein